MCDNIERPTVADFEAASKKLSKLMIGRTYYSLLTGKTYELPRDNDLMTAEINEIFKQVS